MKNTGHMNKIINEYYRKVLVLWGTWWGEGKGEKQTWERKSE